MVLFSRRRGTCLVTIVSVRENSLFCFQSKSNSVKILRVYQTLDCFAYLM